MSERLNNLGLPISSTSHRAIQSGILQLKQPQIYELWESQKPYLGKKKYIYWLAKNVQCDSLLQLYSVYS